jgi:hypothetical protein
MRKSFPRWFACFLVVGLTCSFCFSAEATDKNAQGAADASSLGNAQGAADASSLGNAQGAVAASFRGKWKEYWGTPGQTDVTYHDLYRVDQSDDMKIKVTVLSRKQWIHDESIDQSTLTFTQHTDYYMVKYSLTMQPGNQWMIGTATTPKKIFPVKWERIE